MAYTEERIESQPLYDLVNFGQQVAVNMVTNLADTKHNKFETNLKWEEIADKMSKHMTDLVEMERQIDNSVKASVETEAEIRRLVNQSENSEENITLIREFYDQKLAEVTAANPVDVESNENYKKMSEVLKEFGHRSQEDDDLVAEEEEERIPLDPFSKTEIQNPVKNKKCGHIYDRDQLKQVLAARDKNARQRCPIMGCTNRTITLEDCEVDHKTKALIQRLKNQ